MRERLTCEAVFRMQADQSDGELSGASEALVLAHLEECARCASEAAFERSLDTVLRQKLAAIAAATGRDTAPCRARRPAGTFRRRVLTSLL